MKIKINFGSRDGYLDPGTGNALFAALFGILGSIAMCKRWRFFQRNIQMPN
jgi:hypothetical protein